MQRSEETAFLRRVRQTIRRHAMLAPGDRVVVALSGGPDSVALLAALAALAHDLEIELRAAHLDHGLRGAESDRDRRLAEAVATRLGVPCDVGRAALDPTAGNLEERAREARYRFLAARAAASGSARIATGHTMDDQAETVLLRLLRGAGPDGLGAIRPVRDGTIVRPLIDCSRQSVIDFLHARGLPYATDSSNSESRFVRNRVRHEILPALRRINPAAPRALAAAARLWASESAWLDREAERRLPGAADADLTVQALIDAPEALRARIVRTWLRRRRGDLRQLAGAHVEAVVALATGARPNGRVALPGGRWVVREYGQLLLAFPERPLSAPTVYRLAPGDTLELDSGWHVDARILAASAPPPPRDLWTLAADADALDATLLVRTVRPGDRVQPLGMHGHRKLQDIFVDRKLPAAWRRTCPVVESGGEILWVPGVVRSGRALLTEATSRAWEVRAEAPVRR